MNDTKSPRKSFFAKVGWLAAPIVSCLTAAILVYGTYAAYQQHAMQKQLEAKRTRKKHAATEIEKLKGIVTQEGRPPNDRVTRVRFVPVGEVVDGKTVITESAITDADLKHLRVLTELEEVRLSADGFTNAGLEHLQGLTELRSLSIDNPNVTDEGLEHLKGVISLETLNLTDTSVTEEGVAAIQKELPDCQITFKSTGR